MKIGWDGLTWLFRDLLQKKNDSSLQTGENRPVPDRFVAQVREALSKDTVLLNWAGRDIRCKVDTPVQKGEYLLLQFKEWNGKKQFFKVLDRSFDPVGLEGDRSNITAHLILSGFKGLPLPLLLRMQKYIRDKDEEQERHPAGKTDNSNAQVSFEFIIETNTLGIVIVKIEKQQQYYSGMLLVETSKTGNYLENELYELQQYITNVLMEKNITLNLLHWEVIPIWDLQKIREDLHRISFVLDRKV